MKVFITKHVFSFKTQSKLEDDTGGRIWKLRSPEGHWTEPNIYIYIYIMNSQEYLNFQTSFGTFVLFLSLNSVTIYTINFNCQQGRLTIASHK